MGDTLMSREIELSLDGILESGDDEEAARNDGRTDFGAWRQGSGDDGMSLSLKAIVADARADSTTIGERGSRSGWCIKDRLLSCIGYESQLSVFCREMKWGCLCLHASRDSPVMHVFEQGAVEAAPSMHYNSARGGTW